MKNISLRLSNWTKWTLVLGALALAAGAGNAQIALDTNTYTQNFDTLSSTTTSSVLPTGWLLLETGSQANATYAVGDGSSPAGNTYSFGTASSSDRALGTLLSTALSSTIGAGFTNATGSTITSLTIAYAGEEWRYGGGPDQLTFAYSIDAASLSDGTWTGVSALNLVTPNTTAAANSTLDGNASGNRTAITYTLTGLSISSGSTFYIRWSDVDVTGFNESGLAVDDFSITANPVPEPGVWALLAGGAALLFRFRRTRLA